MKKLLSGLALLLSLNVVASDLSEYQVMSIPLGTKVTFNQPIKFGAGVTGNRLGNNVYIALRIKQEKERILKPRICIIESISGKPSGWMNIFNYTFKLTGEDNNDNICNSIELTALMFFPSVTGKDINEELKIFGIELTTLNPIEI